MWRLPIRADHLFKNSLARSRATLSAASTAASRSPSEVKLPKRGSTLDLEIEAAAHGGNGVARLGGDGGIACFVPNTVPGQLVRARVKRIPKGKSVQCGLLTVLKPSPEEKPIPYQRVPGAPLAGLPPTAQQRIKESAVFDCLERIGGLRHARDAYEGYVESPQIWHYRNKVEYSFSRDFVSPVQPCGAACAIHPRPEPSVGFGLGYKSRGRYWEVENLNADSGLFDTRLEEGLPTLRKWLEATGLDAYKYREAEGFFRHIVARKSFRDDSLVVNLVTGSRGADRFPAETFAEIITELVGGPDRVAGVLHTINDDVGGDPAAPRPGRGGTRVISGTDTLRETIRGLEFNISPLSFFQTNPLCAEKLYDRALEYVGRDGAGNAPKSGDVLVDAFCGTGTLTTLLARAYPECKVVGVEVSEAAVADARASAEHNGASNARFVAADATKWFKGAPRGTTANTVVFDPPRSGVQPDALAAAAAFAPERIVYVSCNPATQARDAALLAGLGYPLRAFSIVNQFPHTAHVETVALFSRERSAAV